MGNMICASLLLAFVLIFTCINSVIICNICDKTISLADDGKMQEAIEYWNNKKSYVSIFVRDAEIDVANAEAEALGESISIEDGETELGRLRFCEAVQEIKNCEKPSFQDVF